MSMPHKLLFLLVRGTAVYAVFDGFATALSLQRKYPYGFLYQETNIHV